MKPRILSEMDTNSGSLALPGIDLAPLVDAVADRLAAKLKDAKSVHTDNDEPLLLTIEQSARKLGRSVSAIEHMIRAGKLKAVRIDSRVQVDLRDILTLIERSKSSDSHRKKNEQTT